MIVRPDGAGHLLLITQPDHAALAGTLIGQWHRDGLRDSPRRDLILLATERHDDGWREPDAEPMVDPASHRIVDFMTAPDSVRQGVWPRGVARLASTPYAAALVAQHAIAVYEPNRVYPEWTPFFERMERLRDEYLQPAAPLTAADLERDYFFVRMGDLLSLTFCCGWLEPRRYHGYDVRWTGTRLVVRPDPFDGREVPMAINARQLDASGQGGGYVAQFRRAPVVAVTGVASGW